MARTKKPENTDKLIELVRILNTDKFQTASELAEQLGVSVRMIYNYIPVLNKEGFDIEKKTVRYRLDRNSAFFKKVNAVIPLTEEEAEFVCRMLAAFEDSNNLAQSVKRKLKRYYNLNEFGMVQTDKSHTRKVQRLNEAMSKKRVVVLKNYSSPNSHTYKDRVVEPFYLFNNGQDVRCHEISSGTNKTFKISRIESVEIQDVPWTYEKKHKRVYTDIFAFSGEKAYIVEMILGQLSHNLLIEEYPQAARFIVENGDGRWRVILNVMSYLGIGRFVLGLYDDIEVIGDEGFKEYLRTRISNMQKP